MLCYCLAAETEEHFLCLQRCLEVDPATFSKSIAILLALEKAELGKVAAAEILAKTPNPNVRVRNRQGFRSDPTTSFEIIIALIT